jgi:hypothetical protein
LKRATSGELGRAITELLNLDPEPVMAFGESLRARAGEVEAADAIERLAG